MATGNSTGKRRARVIVRLSSYLTSARQRMRAAPQATVNWLARRGTLPRILAAILALGAVLIPTGIRADAGHPLHRLFAEEGRHDG